MTEQHKCCRMVESVFAQYACGRTAQYEHLGKWYCKTHHPPTVWAKREARSAEWNKEFAARQLAIKEAQAAKNEAARRAALYPELLEALKVAQPYVSAALTNTGSADAYHAERQVDIAIAKAEGEQT
jgi:hypothetical protein